ncbi:hypothetical protein MAR_007151 [Mya arenaria]|uniref:Uncharacterized protein n=1 Tax=Mya arenaria TaxID=6604 RepID=A0ABY7DD84_MYAAR|nr:hypothetical protein MAR_007151 [Mya arenaria]
MRQREGRKRPEGRNEGVKEGAELRKRLKGRDGRKEGWKELRAEGEKGGSKEGRKEGEEGRTEGQAKRRKGERKKGRVEGRRAIKGRICQRSNVQSAFYDVGDGDTAAFTGSPLNNTLVLTFTSDQRTSNIKISCNRREQSKFTHVNEDPPNTYTFVLETPFACTSPEPPTPKPKHNLSTGSVLLIIPRYLIP